MNESESLTVYYDGACPLCAREVAFYRRQDGADAVSWVDVSSHCGDEVAPGLNREQALARFHIMDGNKRLVSGASAFARLWEALPRFRIMGQLGQRPPISWLLECAYVVFLRSRPLLQVIARATSA